MGNLLTQFPGGGLGFNVALRRVVKLRTKPSQTHSTAIATLLTMAVELGSVHVLQCRDTRLVLAAVLDVDAIVVRIALTNI